MRGGRVRVSWCPCFSASVFLRNPVAGSLPHPSSCERPNIWLGPVLGGSIVLNTPLAWGELGAMVAWRAMQKVGNPKSWRQIPVGLRWAFSRCLFFVLLSPCQWREYRNNIPASLRCRQMESLSIYKGKASNFSYNFSLSPPGNVCVLATTFSYLKMFKTLKNNNNNTLTTGLSAFLNQSLTR